MKIPLHILITSVTMAATIGQAQDSIIIHDWQFNDPAGTAVFNGVQNDGTQAGADTEDWLGTTTDGAGNWHVTGTSENRYSGYWLHSTALPVTADKLILEWAYSSWDWSLHEAKSNIGFGFLTPVSGANGSVTILRNGTSLRTRDTISTDVVNFLSNSYNSAEIPEARVPVDQSTGLELPGAPALSANDTLKFRYTVDFTTVPHSYTADYAVNESEYYTIYTGEWPHGDIDAIRMQAANSDPLGSVKVDYLKLTGVNVEFPSGPKSPWEDVYPLVQGVARDTGIGWISDLQYPFVYHINAASWLYIVPDGASLDNMFGYDYAGGNWFWTSDGYGSWHFNYNIGNWQSWLP